MNQSRRFHLERIRARSQSTPWSTAIFHYGLLIETAYLEFAYSTQRAARAHSSTRHSISCIAKDKPSTVLWRVSKAGRLTCSDGTRTSFPTIFLALTSIANQWKSPSYRCG